MDRQEIERVATEAFFMKADMIKFLLVENLALKTVLHEKGLITAEEYKEHQKRAAEILEEKTRDQIREHLKQLLEKSRGTDGHRNI